MGRKFKISSEEKIFAVQDYLSGKRGATQLQKELQIDNKTLSNASPQNIQCISPGIQIQQNPRD